jgi:hypothetical protein
LLLESPSEEEKEREEGEAGRGGEVERESEQELGDPRFSRAVRARGQSVDGEREQSRAGRAASKGRGASFPFSSTSPAHEKRKRRMSSTRSHCQRSFVDLPHRKKQKRRKDKASRKRCKEGESNSKGEEGEV